MQASSVCPSCHWSGPFESEVCPQCGNSASYQETMHPLPSALREEVLAKAEREWSTAAKALPSTHLRFEVFLLKVARIIKKQIPPFSVLSDEIREEIRQLLENLKWQDLFLACACAEGDNVAWEIFQKRYQSTIRKTALHALGNAAQAQELADTLATDLFLPSQPGASKGDNKIGQYHGMGSLEGWLKVVIHRLAIDRFRIQSRSVSLEDLEVEPVSNASHVQPDCSIVAFDTHKCWQMVSRCLTDALSELTIQDRLVLNMYYLQDLSLKDIGRWLQVHESTASRLLDRLKTDLRKAVGQQLQKEFKVKKNEVRHVIQLAQSHLEIDLKKILTE
jgi:RNA polymerase sigma-70 factor (ECF subfamily)